MTSSSLAVFSSRCRSCSCWRMLRATLYSSMETAVRKGFWNSSSPLSSPPLSPFLSGSEGAAAEEEEEEGGGAGEALVVAAGVAAPSMHSDVRS